MKRSMQQFLLIMMVSALPPARAEPVVTSAAMDSNPALATANQRSPLLAAYLSVPQRYLWFDQCDTSTDVECMSYRQQYLSSRIEVIDDRANGFFSVSGENLDPDISLALFRRPDGSALIAVSTGNTVADSTAFLQRDAQGNWRDVSTEVVPDYSNETRSYGLPAQGTRIVVKEKTPPEPGDFSYDYSGELYKLSWNDGKFLILE